MHATIPQGHPWTFEEVQQLEAETGRKLELIDGALYAMADGSDEHHLLEVELLYQLQSQLVHGPNRGPCRPLPSNAKVRVRDPETKSYRYPDLSIFCGERKRHEGTNTLYTNPTVLFEILSLGSKEVDEVIKLGEYTEISSLQAYVIVHQDEKRVAVHHRSEDGGWAHAEHTGGVFEIAGVPANLDVGQLYASLE